jgi:hypothetical protein
MDMWIAIAGPESGDVIQQGNTKVYVVFVSPNGFSKCECFADGASIGSFGPTSPHKYFTWHAKKGSHTLYAVLTDHQANTATSETITVTVS